MPETPWKTERNTEEENSARQNLIELFERTPIPKNDLLNNLGLFTNRQSLTRTIFMYELYSEIVDIHGDVMEFGTRYGENITLFSNFRGFMEPYNHSRKIIGFDTFEGFPESAISKQDTSAEPDEFIIPQDYEEYLDKLMEYHETESPISHKKKYDLIKGDVTETLRTYLDENPQTIIALAYLDLDLYEPTREVLKLIEPRLPKGAVIGFDELNTDRWPGETKAFDEVLGIANYEIRRSPFGSNPSYIIKK